MRKTKIFDLSKLSIKILFLVFILTITIPLFIRVIKEAPMMPLDISYIHLINSETLREYNLYDVLLNLIPDIMKNYLPIFLGIITFFLLRGVLLNLYKDKSFTNVVLLIFTFNPFTIFMFTTHNSYSLAFVFALCGIISLFFIRRSFVFIVISGIFTSLIALINLGLFFVAILFISLLLFKKTIWKYENRYLVNKIHSIYLLSSILFLIPHLFIPKSPFYLLFYHPTNIVDILRPYYTTIFRAFFEFGGIFSLNLLYLFLSFTYIFVSKSTDDKIFDRRIFVIMLLFSLFYISWRLFFLIPFTVFTSKGIIFLLKRRWKLQLVKNWSLLLIFCLFIFHYGSQINQLSDAEPSLYLKDALIFIKNNTTEDIEEYKVLTEPSLASIVKYFSGRDTPFKENLVQGTMREETFNDISYAQLDFFRLAKGTEVKRFLEDSKTKYILISEDMKQGRIWDKETGVLFVVKNSESFINIYTTKNIEVWKYLGE